MYPANLTKGARRRNFRFVRRNRNVARFHSDFSKEGSSSPKGNGKPFQKKSLMATMNRKTCKKGSGGRSISIARPTLPIKRLSNKEYRCRGMADGPFPNLRPVFYLLHRRGYTQRALPRSTNPIPTHPRQRRSGILYFASLPVAAADSDINPLVGSSFPRG